MTIEEVSKYLRLTVQKLYKLAQRSHIPAYKFGREWRFKRERIDQWVEDQDNTKRRGRQKSHAKGNK